MKTLVALITGRGFDGYQSGLKDRYGDIGYTYEYSKDEDGTPVLILHFSTNKIIGMVKVSENGNLTLKVTDPSKGYVLFNKNHSIDTADDFFKFYPELAKYIRDKEVSPGDTI